MNLQAGTRLGRYEIRSQLGAGGMGEVYLAHDTELERPVAIKVLASEASSNQERMSRFIQEARAASALNHPNIITIYEIGREGPLRFIATEFIEGQTLRQRIAGRVLEVFEVLEISIQVASALAAAHEAGIVHRDIKPENVMVRSDSYVKVLDFGLAKLTEVQNETVNREASTVQMVMTEPGVVLGTVYYMSPEQARALLLDARTDVWSLGVVLYEMASGSLPFAGATTTDVIVSIVEKEPLPLSPEIPAELERIIKKALRKDKQWRYQTVEDMLLDLRTLKQDLEFAGRPRAVVATDSNDSLKLPGTAEIRPTNTAAVETTQTAARSSGIVSRINSHKWKVSLVLSGVALLLLLAALTGRFSSTQTESVNTAPSVASAANTANSTGNTRNDSATPFDPVASKKEITDFLQGWATSFANHDLDAHMSAYAEQLDTYNDRTNVSSSEVRSERLRDLEEYSNITLELPKINITVSSESRAIAIFDKTWGFYGNTGYTGSARQEVWLSRRNGRWIITGEKILQVYDVQRGK